MKTRVRPDFCLNAGYPALGVTLGIGVISPLIANIYLHELDVEMREPGLVMVRYADDAVVLCRSREEAESALKKKSLKSVRDKIRAKTKRDEGHSIEYVIASLNPTLRDWYAYFQHAHHFTFSSPDGFIRRRLRAMLRRQKHRPGKGRCRRDHRQWPNAFFADLGLFTMSEAHRLARQFRCGNN